MAFTRDFTNAPEGALRINGPIQVAIVDEITNAGSKNYIPALGEIVLLKTSNGQSLKLGNGTSTAENLTAITTATELASAIANAGYTTPADVQTALNNFDATPAIQTILGNFKGIDSGLLINLD